MGGVQCFAQLPLDRSHAPEAGAQPKVAEPRVGVHARAPGGGAQSKVAEPRVGVPARARGAGAQSKL